MSTPKIRTTVYNHKVVDAIRINTNELDDLDEIYDIFLEFAGKAIESNKGFIHIKVDRPLSDAEQQHRLGVVEKNIKKRDKYKFRFIQEREYREYLRLKEKFGDTKS